MNIGALIKGLLALGVPTLRKDAGGNMVMVGPDAVQYPLVKVKRASGNAAAATVATGATPTGLDLTSVSDDIHGLIDLINNWINVPSDAYAYRVFAQGAFAANGTGAVRKLNLDGWTGGAVWVAYQDAPGIPHASAGAACILAGGQIAITPAAIPKLRLSALQDSGGNLTFNAAPFTIEFLCT